MTRSAVDDFAEAIQPSLKRLGFTKSGLNWQRSTPQLHQVLNLQRSQWDSEFYVNLGIYINDLGTKKQPAHHHCHIRLRLPHDQKSPEEIVREVEGWFERHDTIAKLVDLAQDDALPPMTTITAHEYLAQCGTDA